MTIRLVDGGWNRELQDAVHLEPSGLCIVSPFIKEGAVGRLLAARPNDVKVITRFNLADFAAGVSDIRALRELLDAGAAVRGIRNLHAKLYMFGASTAIVTSANLTAAALDRNHEFGVVATDAAVIAACRTYFDRLWQRGGVDLSREHLEEWDNVITGYRASGGRATYPFVLGDYGAITDMSEPLQLSLPPAVANAEQSFVKFLGEAINRVDLTYSVSEQLQDSGCHWAVAYPASKRPTGVKDNALIFIGRMTRAPNDTRIFGWATAMKHRPGLDDATPEDIARRPWKAKWSRYIRLVNAEFISGTMGNGVSLNELMEELGANAFAATQRNARRNQGNTNPRRAYGQQAAVELSAEGREWLANRLKMALDSHGRVSRDDLNKLDWPDIDPTSPKASTEGSGVVPINLDRSTSEAAPRALTR